MKKKLKDTKIGKFLKEKAPAVLDKIGDILPSNGTLGIIKNVISQQPDLTAEEKDTFKTAFEILISFLRLLLNLLNLLCPG